MDSIYLKQMEYLCESSIHLSKEVAEWIKESMELAGVRFANFPKLTATPNICKHWCH